MAARNGLSPESPPPEPPFDVAVLGAGRAGGAFARALEGAGHRILAELHRTDDPAVVSRARVVVIAVPDDALAAAAATVAARMAAGAAVVHTSGISGLEPLAACGPNVAAVHPAVSIARPDASLRGVPFGVTCPPQMTAWCERFVRDLGGVMVEVPEERRVLYHAALAMASNFAVAIAGDAAELAGGHEILVPLLRGTIENLATLGPDAALTGPVVRGDAGTVRRHLAALPAHLVESYVANARRALARAVASGRLDAARAKHVTDALEEALVR